MTPRHPHRERACSCADTPLRVTFCARSRQTRGVPR
jgi:hypothetical protein